MSNDLLNLEVWIEAAPLESAQSQIRQFNAENKAAGDQWLAELSDEARGHVDLIRSILPSSGSDRDDRDNPEMSSIVSPITLAYVEQYRHQKSFAERGLAAKPVDVFVWALGEAPERAFTKIGGAPYRPACLPWPKVPPSSGPYAAPEGELMTFLAQLSFVGSHDLFPDLPGDILLIFAEDETFENPDGLYFEWQRLGLSREELLPAGSEPAAGWKFVTCHGCRHRTVDYQTAPDEDVDRRHPLAAASTLNATKIGGLPNGLDWTTTEPDRQSVFLGQIRSIFPPMNQYYPWLNQREPIEDYHGQYFSMVDDGTIFLMLDQHGEVTWKFACG